MNEQFVFPTHTCFDDALDLLGEIVTQHPDAAYTDEFVLVHGIVAPYGDDHSHAWVEDSRRERVLSVGIYEGKRIVYACDRGEYYADIKMKEVTRYTPRQAWEENKRSLHYGPWIEKYRALTRQGKEEQLKSK